MDVRNCEITARRVSCEKWKARVNDEWKVFRTTSKGGMQECFARVISNGPSADRLASLSQMGKDGSIETSKDGKSRVVCSAIFKRDDTRQDILAREG